MALLQTANIDLQNIATIFKPKIRNFQILKKLKKIEDKEPVMRMRKRVCEGKIIHEILSK